MTLFLIDSQATKMSFAFWYDMQIRGVLLKDVILIYRSDYDDRVEDNGVMLVT